MRKLAGLAVIMVMVIGAFTSIPNVSAMIEYNYNGMTLTKSSGTSQPTFGSASGKVCGLELCNSKSIPAITVPKETIVITQTPNKALQKAIIGTVASGILADYYAYKNSQLPEIMNENKTNDDSLFNNFANTDFIKPTPTHTTVMKTPDEMTIQEKKKQQEEKITIKLYNNPDYPTYVKPIIKIENNTGILVSNMTDATNFNINATNIGICGPGTILIDGICMIENNVNTVNTDWADYWDTKEEKEIVLDKVIMTNGTDIIPATNSEDEELDTFVMFDGKKFLSQESADRYKAMKNRTQ